MTFLTAQAFRAVLRLGACCWPLGPGEPRSSALCACGARGASA